MNRLSDVVAGTQNHFASESLSQFTQGFAAVSGLAVSAKVPLDQIAGSLGQLNTNMITGAEAGMAMNSVLTQMASALRKLGFEVSKTSDAGLDLVQTFRNISAAGSTSEKLIADFGIEAGLSVSLLTAKLSDLEAGYRAVNSSAGMTFQNASKMASTLTDRQKALSTSWEVFQERIEPGANAVRSLGVEIALVGVGLFNWAVNIPFVGESLANVTGGAMQLGGALFDIVSNVFQVSTGLLSVVTLFDRFGGLMGMIRSGLTLIGLQLKGMALGFWGVGKAVVGMIPTVTTWIGTMWSAAAAHVATFWPIYAVVGVVAAVAGAVYLVIRNWKSICNFFVALWRDVKILFISTWEWMKGLFMNWHPLGLIIKNWEPIKAFFVELWGGLADLASEAVEWILAPFKKVGGFFSEIGSWFGFGEKKGELIQAGEAIPRGMAQGVRRSEELAHATDSQFARIDRRLPHSDAKEGPFSRLTASGKAITTTMAQGVLLGGNAFTEALDRSLHILFPSPKIPAPVETFRHTPASFLNQRVTKGRDAGKRAIQVNEMNITLFDLPSVQEFITDLYHEIEGAS